MLKGAAATLGLTMLGLTAAALAQAPSGERWQVTSSMEAMGMSMPARTSEICRQAGSDTPPVADDKKCQISNIKRSGNTQTFSMHCSGEHAADGTMTITYLSPDHYKGSMQVNTDGQTMTMNYEGQKLGACNGQETNLQAKKMIDQANAQSAALMQQQCQKASEDATVPSLMTSCHDPNLIRSFCTNFQTYRAYGAQSKMQQQMKQAGSTYGMTPPLDQTAQICGLNIESVRAKLCAGAESSGEFEFLAGQCPAEASALAKAQCTGRSYTSMSATYRGFCSAYVAQNGGDNGAPAPAAGKPGNNGIVPALTNDVTDKAKNTLKSLGGLFGH